MTLRLRPYDEDDEAVAVAIHAAMLPENFHFLLGYDETLTWTEFLRYVDDQRRGLVRSTYRVRGDQLVADVDGEIVGRASIRFELNDFFLKEGGHVGYGVAPDHRRKGYATEILRQAIVVARAEGVGRVLVTCDEDNVGSRRVIETIGGVLESIVTTDDGRRLRRYWIE